MALPTTFLTKRLKALGGSLRKDYKALAQAKEEGGCRQGKGCCERGESGCSGCRSSRQRRLLLLPRRKKAASKGSANSIAKDRPPSHWLCPNGTKLSLRVCLALASL